MLETQIEELKKPHDLQDKKIQALSESLQKYQNDEDLQWKRFVDVINDDFFAFQGHDLRETRIQRVDHLIDWIKNVKLPSQSTVKKTNVNTQTI